TRLSARSNRQRVRCKCCCATSRRTGGLCNVCFAYEVIKRNPMTMDRREFLALSASNGLVVQQQTRPNILLIVADGRRMPTRALFFEHEGTRAVREGRYKLTALRGDSWKLYDMERDRTEMDDLSSKESKLVESLGKKWDVWASENHVTPLPTDYRVDYLRRVRP